MIDNVCDEAIASGYHCVAEIDIQPQDPFTAVLIFAGFALAMITIVLVTWLTLRENRR